MSKIAFDDRNRFVHVTARCANRSQVDDDIALGNFFNDRTFGDIIFAKCNARIFFLRFGFLQIN